MARVFNGTSDLIDCGTPAALADLVPISLVAWVTPAGFGEGGAGRIWAKNGFVGLNMNAAGSTFGGFVAYATGASAMAQASAITLGVTYFLAVTFALGDGGPRLYQGGPTTTVAEVPSYTSRVAESGAKTSDVGQTLMIGARPGAPDRFFDGTLGPCGITGLALSAAELEILRRFTYAARSRQAGGFYMLDEKTGSVRDVSGHGLTGTPTGTTWTRNPRITYRPRTVVA